MDLRELMLQSHDNAKQHGFWTPPPEPGTKLMLMVSELAEAFEEYRSGHRLAEIYRAKITDDDGAQHEHAKPEGVPVELADAIIRICDFAQAYDIPLVEAIEQKMEYNTGRPYMHGRLC